MRAGNTIKRMGIISMTVMAMATSPLKASDYQKLEKLELPLTQTNKLLLGDSVRSLNYDHDFTSSFASKLFSLEDRRLTDTLYNTGGGAIDSGGGDIGEIRYSARLKYQDIINLLRNNGLELKSQFILPLIEKLNPTDLKNSRAQVIYKEMLKGSEDLYYEVRETRYILGDDCECDLTNKSACTFNNKLAPICFNINRIAGKSTSLAELVALVMHEHSHHYVGEFDHLVDLAFAKEIRFMSANFSYQEPVRGPKTFNLEDLVLFDKDGEPYFMRSMQSGGIDPDATTFCQTRGFNVADIEKSKTIPVDSILNTFAKITLDPHNEIYWQRSTYRGWHYMEWDGKVTLEMPARVSTTKPTRGGTSCHWYRSSNVPSHITVNPLCNEEESEIYIELTCK